MLTQNVFDSSMNQLLSVIIDNFAAQGIVCELTSPTSFSFSSEMSKSQVKEFLEGCSVPLQFSFESQSPQTPTGAGCYGMADVQGVPRADE